jgi:hypothetical protein
VAMFASSFENNFCKEKKSLLCYFKMFATIDVKLSIIWDERRDVWEG